MGKIIGRVIATEKNPSTIDEFYFWTNPSLILNPFDVVKVEHINESYSFGVIEEIYHITDSASFLSDYISNDFGNVDTVKNTNRIGMNYVKASIVANTKGFYIPLISDSKVSLATKEEVSYALGLDEKNIKKPMVCGYIEMYEDAEKDSKVILPVNVDARFLIGPEGAHLNISGISGLASKTSYAMFLLKSLQDNCLNGNYEEDVAFILFNVKGCDLLTIDQENEFESQKEKEETFELYKTLGLTTKPFKNVKYYYPYSEFKFGNTYANSELLESQKKENKAFAYKYTYQDDKKNLDLLFSNIEDSTQSMDSILNYIITEQGEFGSIVAWDEFLAEIQKYMQAGNMSKNSNKEITVASWRKFNKIIRKSIYGNPMFSVKTVAKNKEVRLTEELAKIKKNDVMVIDIAKLNENMQSFVFGDVIRAIYDLKLGGYDSEKIEYEPPSRIVIFIDELNKYASSDLPKSSPILNQVLDIAERGRSLGIILFSAEQFKSAIHNRVTGNCSTHAYGRTNAIEISKSDYKFIPSVYKNMMTRLKQGEYILQNPVFRSLLNIKFPKPIYNQIK